ncbi:MAG: Stp1/IreP family PP2C-type Ser/Thr phosphatase [Tissierellia bacterium]|nr:Stp1/IreP family PP2C-type Ser/Thr phosphatase [Tissierellia bacterium]
MKYSSISNIGKVRNDNQDFYGALELDKHAFFIVADGLGAHNRGDAASKLAVKYIIKYIKENINKTKTVNLQEEAISYANSVIYDYAQSSEEFRQMGTTVVCVCLDYDNQLYHFSHVGDSRAYLFTGGILKQITRDHSVVNELLDSGSISEEEAKNYNNKSAITKAVGIEKTISPDSISFEMNKDDIVLMVTDGLSNELSHEEITTLVSQNNTAEDISKNLVDLAIRKGGHDNITVTTIMI